MAKRRDIHERVLTAKSPDEVAAAYGDWAESYDADLIKEMGYPAPIAAAKLLHSHLTHLDSSSACILDAGCGTGLVGQELSRLGYRQITGIDYSVDMLAHAKLKNVYSEFSQCDLTMPLAIADGQFDAVTCVGTFSLGHIGPSSLPELIRVTARSGFICFTVRDEAWDQEDYESIVAELCRTQNLTVIENRLIPYIEEEGSMCHLCLLQVN